MDWAYHTDDLRAATQLYNAQYDGSGPYDSGYLIEHEQHRHGLSDQQHPGSPTSDNKKPVIVTECGLIRLKVVVVTRSTRRHSACKAVRVYLVPQLIRALHF